MPLEVDPVTRLHLVRAADELAEEFAGVFTVETVLRAVNESAGQLGGTARFADFLPVLAHRFARERLQASAQAAGTIAKEVPEVLFVCVQNAGRSQMAAALLARHAGGKVNVRTAGSAPAAEINAEALAALAELGIDASTQYPKPLTDEFVEAADVVVTMGCGDACPVYPGKRYEDWDVPDPAGRPLVAVRAIRDELEARVRQLLAEVLEAAHQSATTR